MSSPQKLCSGVLGLLIIWLIILMVPRQREWTVRQLTVFQPQSFTAAFPGKKALQKVLSQHPDDPRVLSFAIEKQYQTAFLQHINQSNSEPNDNAYYLTIKDCIRQYDDLIQRFPAEHWLVQNRLRLTLTGLDAVNFDFTTFFSTEAIKQYSINPNMVSGQELKQGIILAQQGMKTDPSNSFYNWAQAAFYFAMKQKGKAIATLEQGAGKPNYDDGILLELQRRAGILKLTGTDSWANLTRMWQVTKYADSASASPMTWTTWAAIHQAAIIEKKGDHQHALDIYGALMKLTNTLLNRPVFKGHDVIYRELFLARIWVAESRRPPRISPNTVLTAKQAEQTAVDNWLEAANRFSQYANKHHRPDLAQQASALARKYVSLAYDPPTNHGLPEEIGGLPIASADQLARVYWVQSQILYVVLLCAIFAIISFLMLHFCFAANPTKKIAVQIWDIIGGAVFSIAATAFYVNAALKLASANEGIFLKAELVNFSNFDIRNSVLFLGNMSLWGPVLLVVSFIAWCRLSVLWRTRKITYPERGNFGGILFKWGRTVGSLLVIFLLLLWAFAVQLCFPWRLHTMLIAIAPALFYLTCMIVHKSFVVIQNIPIYRQRIHYFYQWLPRFLASFCLLGSVIYLILALGVLPRHADARFQLLQLFKNGEVASRITPPLPPAR